MKQYIKLDKLKTQSIEQSVDIQKAQIMYSKKLRSIFKSSKIEAIVYLGLLGTDSARLILEEALSNEKDYTLKLYLVNALSDIGNKESIPAFIETFKNSHYFYRNRANMLISNFGEDFNNYLPEILKSENIRIKELIVYFSSIYFSEYTKRYLIDLIESYISKTPEEDVIIKDEDRKLAHKACDIVAKYYPSILDDERYLNSNDIEIQNISITALSNLSLNEKMEKLIIFLKNDNTARSAVNAISKIIARKPSFINVVVSAFNMEQDDKVRQEFAKILSSRIEYFIMKLSRKNKLAAAQIIKEILYLGRTSEVIDFLNKNRDIDIENELVAILREVFSKSTLIEKEFTKYLNENILIKCGLTSTKEVEPKREEKKDKKLIRTLYILLILSFLIVPIIYGIRHQDILFEMSFIKQAKIFVIDFNYYLAYYSMTISIIYLSLLVLSYFSAKKQSKLWNLKNMSLLFKREMLPTVSIIAPAYNEEKTIIESSNSLLNLKYPDYELIIVNDGSDDKTLDVLIKYFNLIRVDYVFDYTLNTRPVRGIYMNRSMPKLIVVDKENGGKADSLNSGINISNKEYYCGIDADSILEEESLLKIASLTLDAGMETPALGGNIFPINGCTIERGQIKNINIPHSSLGRFQAIEYIRAFMTGRLGWAYINSLLIISGAFGLFRKERVISVGGYLTSSGKYEKDTVGEDMELVVRISRLMRELGQKYKIYYASNANCWTEVPEDMKTLRKQRYRWHRGLIDIVIFHKKMIFNPKYGRTGIVAIPYYFIFEMMGPIIEMQGYIMVVLALIFGILNFEITLILFVSTILFGMLISISSLIIAERDMNYFSFKDTLILIAYSIIENFGPRQIFSFWRVGGYFNSLRKSTGWNKAERKGFSSNASESQREQKERSN